jgi:hypothetical protein
MGYPPACEILQKAIWQGANLLLQIQRQLPKVVVLVADDAQQVAQAAKAVLAVLACMRDEEGVLWCLQLCKRKCKGGQPRAVVWQERGRMLQGETACHTPRLLTRPLSIDAAQLPDPMAS